MNTKQPKRREVRRHYLMRLDETGKVKGFDASNHPAGSRFALGSLTGSDV